MYSDGDFAEIQRYCESDVVLVYDCMQKIKEAKTEPTNSNGRIYA